MKIMQSFRSYVNRYTFIGIAIGLGSGMYAFSLLVPSGMDMIGLYYPERLAKAKSSHMLSLNEKDGHHQNKYMMGKVTSEEQFLKDMVLHHEAAVEMARQVLLLNPRAEVKKLADDIINAQTTEIKMMNDWLAAWK